MDAWRWEEVRIAESDFPRHPILGRVYKLYAFEGEIERVDDHGSIALSRPGRSDLVVSLADCR